MTRTQRFALALLQCKLNDSELAHAMSWTIKEAYDFRRSLSQKKRTLIKSLVGAPAPLLAKGQPPLAGTI
jgi:hypothetical protein